MEITASKICAAIIASMYATVLAVGMIVHEGGVTDRGVKSLVGCLLVLLVPLALIWFPDEIGSAKGAIGHGTVDSETPAFLVSSIGWLILVGVPIVVYFIGRN